MFEEVKVWIHVAIGVALVAGSSVTAWKLTADYYRDEILRTQHSQDQAVRMQTDRALTAERNQKTAEDAVETEHAQHVHDSTVLAGQLSRGLRDLQGARLRAGALRGPVVDPGGPAGTPSVPRGDQASDEGRRRLEEATRRFDQARDEAIAACTGDATELGDILNLAARQNSPTGGEVVK